MAYVGQGDFQTYQAYWGLRAINAAYATGSNNCCSVRRSSDSATATFVILASGDLDQVTAATFAGTASTGSGSFSGTTLTYSGTIFLGSQVTGPGVLPGTFVVSGSGSTWTLNQSSGTLSGVTIVVTNGMFVTQLNDQTTNALHMTQATAANQPVLLLYANNGRPTIGSRSSVQPIGLFNTSVPVAGAAAAQPYAITWTAQRNDSFTTALELFIGATSAQVGWDGSANNARIYGLGAVVTQAAADNAYHSNGVTMNGASSIWVLDNIATSGLNPGTGQLGSGTWGLLNDASLTGGQGLDGFFEECGVVASAPTSTQLVALVQNALNYWNKIAFNPWPQMAPLLAQ